MDESEEAKRKKRVNARTNTQVNASIRFPAVSYTHLVEPIVDDVR